MVWFGDAGVVYGWRERAGCEELVRERRGQDERRDGVWDGTRVGGSSRFMMNKDPAQLESRRLYSMSSVLILSMRLSRDRHLFL